MHEVITCIQTIFEQSCYALFESFNCEVKTLSEHSEELYEYPFVFIDAGSEDIELIIYLQLPISVLSLTYPVTDVIDVDDKYLEDWLGELSNQLIGRLKNTLLQHGVTLQLGLPNCCFDLDIKDVIENHDLLELYLDIDGQECACYLSIEIFNNNMAFSLEVVDDDIMDEGEIEFF